ncbi:hypothetical protein MASR2M117_16130 [Paludibacter sp.]
MLESYLQAVPKDTQKAFDAFQEAEISTDNFNFYVSVASVYSSKIEGEEIELDNYLKHIKFDIEFLPDYTKKIEDLYDAYTFAKSHKLNLKNISEVHKLLSKNIVAENWQGKFRHQNMYVITEDGKIEYVAVSHYEVVNEMEKLYHDIKVLLDTPLTIEEVFYFASFIHLVL